MAALANKVDNIQMYSNCGKMGISGAGTSVYYRNDCYTHHDHPGIQTLQQVIQHGEFDWSRGRTVMHVIPSRSLMTSAFERRTHRSLRCRFLPRPRSMTKSSPRSTFCVRKERKPAR